MKESVFVKEIVDTINAKYGWAAHAPAGPWGNNGFPDVIAYFYGKPFAFECKIVTKLPKKYSTPLIKYGFTKLQCSRLHDMHIAGGVTIFGLINVRPDQAFYIVEPTPDLNFTIDEILKEDTKYPPNVKIDGYWDMSKIFNLEA